MENEQYIPQFDVAQQLFERIVEDDSSETERMLHEIVVQALAKARLKARRQGEKMADWQPTLEDFAEDERVLQRTIERAEIIQMLDSYLDGIAQELIETILKSDQIAALEDIYDFLLVESDETLSKETPLGRLTKSGHLDLATNWGKSVLIFEFLNIIDVGRTRSNLKTLVLINSRRNVQDLVGRSGPEPTGLAKFAPDIPAVALSDTKSGDEWKQSSVVVMTYDMFRRRFKAGELDDFDAGLILADEGHYALGEETRAAFDAYREGKLSLIFTATTESGGKHVSELAPFRISIVEPRTLIESGRASEAQIFGVATRQKMQVTTSGPKRIEFTEAELKGLRNSQERSQIAVDVATVFAEEGRRVLVHCLPGDRCAHAEIIAQALNGQEIFDTSINQNRTLVAKAVHGFMPQAEQDKIIDDFKQGKIDILTQVDLLNESFDSQFVEAAVYARPVKSPRLGKQQFGRAMRHNRWGRTLHCYLLDDIEGAQQYTAFHILGEEHFEQGMVISRKDTGVLQNGDTIQLRPPVPINRSTQPRIDWLANNHVTQSKSPEQLTQFMRPDFDTESKTDVREELFGGLTTTNVRPPVPSGFLQPGEINPEMRSEIISLKELPIRPQFEQGEDSNLPKGMTPEGEARFSQLLGKEAVDIAVVRELMVGRQEVFESPPTGWIPLRDFTAWGAERELDIQAVRNILTKEAGFECKLINIRRGKFLFYVPPESKAFLDAYEVAEWAPDGWLTAHRFMEKMLNKKVPVTFMLLERIIPDSANGIESVSYRCRITRRKLPHYSPEMQDKMQRILEARAARVAPETGKTALSDLAKEVGQRNGAVQFYLRRHHGIEGETLISPKSNMEALFYDDEEIKIARYHFKHEIAPKGAVFLEALRDEYKVTDEEMDDLIAAFGFADSIGVGRAAGKAGMGEIPATVYGKYVPQAEGVELERALKALVFERDHPSVPPQKTADSRANNKRQAAITKHSLESAERTRTKEVAEQDLHMRQLRRERLPEEYRYSFGHLLVEINADERYVLRVLKRMYNPEFVRKISRFGHEAPLPPRMYEHLVKHFTAYEDATDEWWSSFRIARHVGVSEASAQEAIRSLTPPHNMVRVMYSMQDNQRRLGPHFNIAFAVNVVRRLEALKAQAENNLL